MLPSHVPVELGGANIWQLRQPGPLALEPPSLELDAASLELDAPSLELDAASLEPEAPLLEEVMGPDVPLPEFAVLEPPLIGAALVLASEDPLPTPEAAADEPDVLWARDDASNDDVSAMAEEPCWLDTTPEALASED